MKEKLQPTILYEDKYILVLAKPAGLPVHGDGKVKEYTLSDWLVEKYPELEKVGEPLVIEQGGEKKKVLKPGLVHRLDKDTSGVMIVAKTKTMYERIKEQFEQHKIRKTYYAFIHGWPREWEGRIDAPIGRSGGDIRKWNASKGKRGELRDAITLYEVLEKIGSHEENKHKGNHEPGAVSFIKLLPQTGRTHQLRVHMQFLGTPIVGDGLYATGKPKLLNFARTALHAYVISFVHPKSGKKVTFEAPFPEDFVKAMKKTKVFVK